MFIILGLLSIGSILIVLGWSLLRVGLCVWGLRSNSRESWEAWAGYDALSGDLLEAVLDFGISLTQPLAGPDTKTPASGILRAGKILVISGAIIVVFVLAFAYCVAVHNV